MKTDSRQDMIGLEEMMSKNSALKKSIPEIHRLSVASLDFIGRVKLNFRHLFTALISLHTFWIKPESMSLPGLRGIKAGEALVLIIILLTSSLQTHAQILEPASWEYVITKDGVPITSAKSGETVELFFRVKLDATWYIYSIDQNPDLGPVPTAIEFEEDENFQIIGNRKPIKLKEKYDEVWKGKIRIIEESGGGFVQKVKLLSDNPTITGYIAYTVCSMETGQCVFPEDDFEFKLSANK